MKRFNPFYKSLAILLALILVFELPGCVSVKSVAKEEAKVEGRSIVYIHTTDSVHKVLNVKIDEGIISGTIDSQPYSSVMKMGAHIYVAPAGALERDGDVLRVGFKNITKVEVGSIDVVKIISIITGGFVAFFFFVLITKGASCPFIYAYNGTDYVFMGEIFSGATAIPLERHDYLPLNGLKPVGNEYKMRITNEVQEIQNTNLLELMVFDHPAGTDILVDKYGTAQSVTDPVVPVSAKDSYGNSIIAEISKKDSLRYISSIKRDENIQDTISIVFHKPKSATTGKLILNGKNSIWLDYMFVKFANLFGNKYDNWKKQRDKKTKEELMQWSIDQGMPLSVYLETENGLKSVDYFNLAGPMADKMDVLEIDLSEVKTDEVRLKLVSGVLFWDIDYLGMDFSSPINIKPSIIPLRLAVDEKGKDVTSLLTRDDDKYLTQPLPTNVTDIHFLSPEAVSGMTRTVFLHSKGYYEILRETKGKPDVGYLKTFREPGAFTRFSKDHFVKYYFSDN